MFLSTKWGIPNPQCPSDIIDMIFKCVSCHGSRTTCDPSLKCVEKISGACHKCIHMYDMNFTSDTYKSQPELDPFWSWYANCIPLMPEVLHHLYRVYQNTINNEINYQRWWVSQTGPPSTVCLGLTLLFFSSISSMTYYACIPLAPRCFVALKVFTVIIISTTLPKVAFSMPASVTLQDSRQLDLKWHKKHRSKWLSHHFWWPQQAPFSETCGYGLTLKKLYEIGIHIYGNQLQLDT